MQCKATFQRPILSLNTSCFSRYIYDNVFTGEKEEKKGKTLKLPISKTFNHKCSVRVLKENNSYSLKSFIQLSQGLRTVRMNAFLSSVRVLSPLAFLSILLSEAIDVLFPNGNLA